MLSAVVVGAGFSGIAAGITLKKAGITDFVILEKADRVGGTWRENTYPGAACDVPSHLYSFSFEPNPAWSRTYGTQPEILAYLLHCVRKYDVGQFIRCRARVAAARFDEARGVWAIDVDLDGARKTIEADLLIAASGPLSRPSLPDIDGLDRFEGRLFHSARWDHDYALEGRRVGVIGNAERDIVLAQQLEHLDTVPAIMAKLESDPPALRHQLHEIVEPLRIGGKPRRQLKQHRPGFRPQNLQSLLDQRQ